MEHPVSIITFMPPFIQQNSHVFYTFIVLLFVLGLGLLARRMTAEVPGKGQLVIETLVGGLYNLGEGTMGEKGVKYMPFILGIGCYVWFSNLMGLIPGFAAPTMSMNTTAAPAICVFLLYQYIGIKAHGAGYIKHFLGPMPLLAPLIFCIEIVGHLARPLSLTMRLFGNISGEELVIMVLFSLVPFMLPLPMYFLAVFTGTLQAFVFMLLTMVYIGGALEEAH